MTATRGRTLGAEITVEILNNTAGAITTAWTAGDFNLAGAWVDPGAFGLRRSITFIGQATKLDGEMPYHCGLLMAQPILLPPAFDGMVQDFPRNNLPKV